MSEKLTEADFDQMRRDAEYQANRFPNDDWPPTVISLLTHIAEVTARAEEAEGALVEERSIHESAEAGERSNAKFWFDCAKAYEGRAEAAEAKVARLCGVLNDYMDLEGDYADEDSVVAPEDRWRLLRDLKALAGDA